MTKQKKDSAPSWRRPETMASFRDLLADLMATHGQDKNAYRISNRTGLSYPSLDKWAKGTGLPNLASTLHFAKIYGLPEKSLIDLVQRSQRGGYGFIDMRAQPRQRRIVHARRAVSGALAALALVASGGSATASSIVPDSAAGQGALCQLRRRRLGVHPTGAPTRRRALWWGRDRRLRVVPTPIFATTCA